jgi:hypothetical protein
MEFSWLKNVKKMSFIWFSKENVEGCGLQGRKWELHVKSKLRISKTGLSSVMSKTFSSLA